MCGQQTEVSTFPRTSNGHVQFEIKNTVPVTLAFPKMTYLSINLTKQVLDLYEENYKTDYRNLKSPK